MIDLAIILFMGALASAIISMIIEAPLTYFIALAPLLGAVLYLGLGLVYGRRDGVKIEFHGLLKKRP